MSEVFYIRPKIFSIPNSEQGQFSKIVFTDENENEKTYYVRNNSDTPEYFDLYVYAPGEYVDFDFKKIADEITTLIIRITKMKLVPQRG